MALDSQKLLPQGNRGGALAVSRPKVSLVRKEDKKDIKSEPNTILVIKTRVIEIEKILKGSVALDKKLLDQERKQRENALRDQEETELETKDEDGDKKVKKKATKVKLGFLDGLIKYIKDVLMGFVLVRLIDFLPKLKKIVSILGGVLDFFTNTVLGIVNALGTFLMWGDKVISGSRNFVKNIFGEKGAEVFDKIIGTIGNLFNLIAILGMTAAAFGGENKKQKQKDIKNRTKGNKKLKERYERRQKFRQQKKRIQRKKFFKKRTPKAIRKTIQRGKIAAKKFTKGLKKVPKKIIKSVGKNVSKTASKVGKNLIKSSKSVVKTGGKVVKSTTKGLTTAAKTATTAAKSAAKTAAKTAATAAKTATTAAKTVTTTATKLGKTGLKTGLKGLKSLQKVVSPIVKKIPFIGALLDFALNYFVFKEPLGRAAFMAIGAGLAAWLGGIIGSVIPVGGTLVGAALGGWAGDKLAGMLYDAIFKGKDTPKKTTNARKKNFERDIKTTIDRSNQPKTMDLLTSGKRGNIEQGLYNMRLSASKGSEEAFNDWVGNEKYAGDVDLIMEHGLENVTFEGGRVTLKNAYKASLTPVDVDSVAAKTESISKSASYEEDVEEVVVVNSSAPSGGGETQSNETMPVETSSTGGGEDFAEALYEGG